MFMAYARTRLSVCLLVRRRWRARIHGRGGGGIGTADNALNRDNAAKLDGRRAQSGTEREPSTPKWIAEVLYSVPCTMLLRR